MNVPSPSTPLPPCPHPRPRSPRGSIRHSRSRKAGPCPPSSADFVTPATVGETPATRGSLRLNCFPAPPPDPQDPRAGIRFRPLHPKVRRAKRTHRTPDLKVCGDGKHGFLPASALWPELHFVDHAMKEILWGEAVASDIEVGRIVQPGNEDIGLDHVETRRFMVSSNPVCRRGGLPTPRHHLLMRAEIIFFLRNSQSSIRISKPPARAKGEA